MKVKIKVNPETGMVYLPNEMREAGYVGDVEVLPNHFVAVLKKPGANLEQVVKSLNIIMQDLQHQIEAQGSAIKL